MGESELLLVVDDDALFRERLVAVLERLGHRAVGVDGVRGALDVLGQRRVAAVLLDLSLNGPSGSALLQGLNRAGHSIPVIMVSGSGELDEVIAAFRNGAVDWLRKPLDVDELEGALDRAQARSGSPTRSAAAPDRERRPQTGRARRAAAEQEEREQAAEEADDTSARTRAALDKLVAAVRAGRLTLPPLHPTAEELRALFAQPATGAEDVIQIVERDPAVAASILRLANSSRFQPGRPITTLHAACVRLGNRRILAIAQEVIVEQLFEVDGHLGEVAEAMWANVRVTSQGARLLAELHGSVDPDEAHLAALFHNLGELALLRGLVELGGIGSTGDGLVVFAEHVERWHERVGSSLMKAWGMDPRLAHLAGDHHPRRRPPETEDGRLRRLLVEASWQMALQSGFTYLPGQEGVTATEALGELGVEEVDASRLFRGAADWV